MLSLIFHRRCGVGSYCAHRILLALSALLYLGLGAIPSAQAQPYTRVYGWGSQVGNGTTSTYSVPAMTELYGKTLVAVAAGSNHKLALDSNGVIYAWGSNWAGQLGDNSTTDRLVPVIVNTTNGVSALHGKTVIAIAAGDSFSLALASDGTVYSWGYNDTTGKLGNNSTVASSVPVAITTSGVLSGKTITAISAGNHNALALDSDGKVYSWGSNINPNNNQVLGQLGNGSGVQYSRVPVAVTTSGVLSGKTVTAIACGFFHSMVCTSDGNVYAWGGNFNGMLGNGSTTSSNVPVAVTMSGALAGKSVTSVAMGYVHSLCLASDGTVYAWGFGYNGTNGSGSNAQTTVPVAVKTSGVLSGKTIVAITGGFYHCAALASDGSVYTWGGNFGGELGINGPGSQWEPVAVNTISGLSALAGATVQSLAKTSSAAETFVIASSSTLSAPYAPINVTATAGDHQAIVSFTAPPSTGGSTITSYTVTASPGGATQSGPFGTYTFAGLTNGVDYTFTITATNALGTSVASVASTPTTPPVPYAFATFAGSGGSGLVNGTGTATQFSSPYGIAVESNSGNLYIADSVNHVIRMITNGQVVTTMAGSGGPGSNDDTGTAASFNAPMGVAVDPFGNVYVADSGNSLIRRISNAGVVTTYAGSGTPGSANGIGTAAEFNNPMGVATDIDGVIYVADTGNHKIRKIATDGTVTTLAGDGSSGLRDDLGPYARFNTPTGVVVDSAGVVYVADSGNNVIRKIPANGFVTTWAGDRYNSGSTDAIGTNARFNNPTGVAVDEDNNVYVADRNNHKIRKIATDRTVTTVAGLGSSGTANGLAAVTSFNNPTGIAVDSVRNLFVADFGNQMVRYGTLAQEFDLASATTASGTTGTSFSYQIVFTQACTSFTATGLPPGLSVDASTGEISGIPTAVGTYAIIVGGTNATGEGAGTVTTTIAKGAQAAMNVTSPASGIFNSAYTATASGGSGTGAITWSLGTGSDAPGAGIDPSTGAVTSTGAGTVVINATKAADANYQVATSSDFTITLGKAAQSALSVTSSSTGTFGSSYSPTYSGGSGMGAVTWSLGTGSTAAGAAIDSSTGAVTSNGAGTVAIKVTKAADANYLAASSSDFAVTLGKSIQASLSITSSNSGTFNSSYTATATGGNGSGALVWALGTGSTAPGATINSASGAVTSSGSGIVMINVHRATDADYLVSSTTADFTVTLAKAVQTTLAVSSSASATINANYNATASGGDGTGVLTWSLGTGSTATGAAINSSSGAVISMGAGTVVIKVSKAADGDYLAAISADFTITVFAPYAFTTFAGSPGLVGTTDATGTAARFHSPDSIAVDSSGNLYVVDQPSNTIRKITPAGVVTTLAGLAGQSGSTDATGSAARFNGALGVAVDGSGNVYVADQSNHTIRKITPAGVVTTFAGLANNSGTTDDSGTAARLNLPVGVAVDGSGNIYVSDNGNYTVRKITSGGAVTTFAGSAGNPGSTDGTGTAAQFQSPGGIAVDGAGNVYLADYASIRKITPSGAVTTLAGSNTLSGSADDSGSAARFDTPFGVAVDNSGNIHVTDAANNTVRMITPGGVVTTLAGLAGSSADSVDGTGSAARFDTPFGVAVDSTGYLYVADFGNQTIRKGHLPFAPSFTTQPANQTVTVGTAITFTPATTGWPSSTFQWQKNSTDIAGATGASYTIASPVAGDAGDYRVIATNSVSSTTSAAATLTVNKASQATLTITSSSSGIFGIAYTATATGGTGTGVLIWALGSGSTAAGAAIDPSSGTVTSTGAGTVVINVHRATDINYLVSPTTSDFTITLAKAAQSSLSIISSASGTFNSSYIATASGGSGSGILSWSLGSGSTANSAAINPSSGAVTSTGAGTVVIKATKAADTNYNAATSTDFTITLGKASGSVTLGNLSATYDGSTHAANTTTSPASLTVAFTYNGSATAPTNAGTYAVVSTINDANYQGSASGSLVIARATPVISWTAPASIAYGTALSATQLNATANISGTFAYSPANGTILDLGSQTLNVTFTPTDITNYATATAQQTITVSPVAPSIITSPADRAVAPGENALFSVVVSGYPAPTYQWQLLPTGSSTWSNLPNSGNYSGVTTATLLVSTTTLAMNGDQFRCIATNAAGAAVSNAGLLTVTTATIAPSEAVVSFTVE